MGVSKKARPPGISMVRSHALRAAATGMRVAPLREVPGVPPEQPSDNGRGRACAGRAAAVIEGSRHRGNIAPSSCAGPRTAAGGLSRELLSA
jgi:hypothetical protein